MNALSNGQKRKQNSPLIVTNEFQKLPKRENTSEHLNRFMDKIIEKNPGETEFHQSVNHIAQDILPFIKENQKYEKAKIFERMVEPDRCIQFKVCWEDDSGEIQINKGYRVQFNNAIGPYKGGLRYHPSVNLSVLKFLGFEQIFKNSLTQLPLGAGKGGSDFDPKGKSDREVMRFCQSFMTELKKHIGHNTDVPAGDIGVGEREIGYLFGQYKKLQNEFSGAMTGKSIEYGGSLLRKQATGYGCAYFMEEMLNYHEDSIKNKVCLVSGAGNVAQHVAEKIIQLGGKVVTFSDSSGFIHDPSGIDDEKLEYLKELKNVQRERLYKYAERFRCKFYPKQKPWDVKAELAFPSATQNEIMMDDAVYLAKNGCKAVAEGANMPTTLEAAKIFKKFKLLFAPGIAANAGGVAVSGLEMSQNHVGLAWPDDDVDKHLKKIMRGIHVKCLTYGLEDGTVNYVKGANIGGFLKVADAMLAQGVV